ncbi:unnamed protein product [Urochloa humidicola]
MEVHAAPAVGKRMWSYLRAVFFMVRKGLLSNKRKLLVSMHLLVKRRNRAVSRTVAALLSHHGHHHGHGGYSSNALRRRDYEFSCSNSPAADFSSAISSSRRYFPCLGAVAEDDDDYSYYAAGYPIAGAASPQARIEYYAASAASPSSPPGLDLLMRELAPGEPEEESCCASPALQLGGEALSVRVSNYSAAEGDEGAGAAVDDEAEEFIRRFYEQLRSQNTVVALLPYMQESAA